MAWLFRFQGPRRSHASAWAGIICGLTTALVTIPDGLASAVLAGLNPVHGLFALMVAMPLAALIVLTFLVGAIQLALGLLKLGAIARFVSNMVMIAWLYPRSVSRAPAPRAAIKPPKKFWA